MTTSRDELLRELSNTIVSAVLSDLMGRKGLGDEWDQIDDDVQNEIICAWNKRINSILLAAPPSAEGLTEPAWVGNTSFGIGVNERWVIERAQREYKYQQTPERIAERKTRADAFFEEITRPPIPAAPKDKP